MLSVISPGRSHATATRVPYGHQHGRPDGVSTGTRWRTHPPASWCSEHTIAGASSTNGLTPCSKKTCLLSWIPDQKCKLDKCSTKKNQNLQNWNLRTCKTKTCWNRTSRVHIVDDEGITYFQMFLSSPRQWFGRKEKGSQLLANPLGVPERSAGLMAWYFKWTEITVFFAQNYIFQVM
jgi:hypothetical protein